MLTFTLPFTQPIPLGCWQYDRMQGGMAAGNLNNLVQLWQISYSTLHYSTVLYEYSVYSISKAVVNNAQTRLDQIIR